MRTSSDRWHRVPLILELFPSLGVRAYFFLKLVLSLFITYFSVCNTLLGVVPFGLFLGPIRLSPSLSFREVLRGVRASLVRFLFCPLHPCFFFIQLRVFPWVRVVPLLCVKGVTPLRSLVQGGWVVSLIA